MATLPMTQPGNPNQQGGLPVNPMGTPSTQNGGVVGATVPTAKAVSGTTGTGASTYGQAFGGVSTTLPTVNSQATGISSGLSTVDGSNTLVGDFSDTYGKGTGTALATILAGLGTSTDSAVTATNNQILQAAGLQQANMTATQAAHGVSSDSSTAALATGDFNAQVNTALQSTDANMELSEYNTLISSLQQEGTAHGGDSSWTDSLGSILGLGGSAAGAISEGFGIGGTTGSILDALSSL